MEDKKYFSVKGSKSLMNALVEELKELSKWEFRLDNGYNIITFYGHEGNQVVGRKTDATFGHSCLQLPQDWDKVFELIRDEPKFKVGDWIHFSDHYSGQLTYRVVRVVEDGYYIISPSVSLFNLAYSNTSS